MPFNPFLWKHYPFNKSYTDFLSIIIKADEVVLNEALALDDELIGKAAGGDGTLPGGMPPDMLKNLVSNPELMALMQNPKMQDVMKMMMTGGQEALEKAMKEDNEIYEIVTKLNSVMGDAL